MITMALPTLYGQTSRGQKQSWTVRVIDNGSSCTIERKFGHIGGKMQTITKVVRSGKNKGKANETSVLEQAMSDAASLWNKKKDENYRETAAESPTSCTILPMLALKYGQRGKDIHFPAYMQPKLDGIRCVASWEPDSQRVRLYSRLQKEFSGFQHVVRELQALCTGRRSPLFLDGELYSADITFQQIVSIVKKADHPDKSLLQYHIFDCYEPTSAELDYEDRKKTVDCFQGETCVSVPTLLVPTAGEVGQIHQQFIQEGHEGSILRNVKGCYQLKARSKNLQKLKDFMDSEYTIVGVKEATGEDRGTAVMICETAKGQQFSARPEGSRTHRRQLLQDAPKLINSKAQATIRYYELTDDGIPRFPVLVSIRNYE